MVIRTRFDIHQNVGIIALKNKPALIESIIVDGKNVLYDISYWVDQELKSCKMHEFEISETVNEVE
jgi:hypothetical protein